MEISLGGMLDRNPHLELIETDVFNISQRIKEIEREYFIVYNKKMHRHEVHSTANKGYSSYCFSVPYKQLDSRTLDLCNATNLAQHGDRVVKKFKRENEKLKQDKERAFKKDMRDASREMQSDIVYAMEKDDTNDSYKRSHVVNWEG